MYFFDLIEQRLNDLVLGKKLLGSYLLIIILLLVIAITGYTNMKNINDGMSSMYYDRTIPIEEVGEALADMNYMRGDIIRATSLPEEADLLEQSLQNRIQKINTNVDKYRATYLLDSEKSNLSDFDQSWTVYRDTIPKYFEKIRTRDLKGATEMLAVDGAFYKSRSSSTKAIENILAINIQEAERLNNEADATFAYATLTIIMVAIISIIIAISLGFIITRNLTRRFGQLLTGMDTVKSGELSYRVRITGRDELAQAGDSFDSMAESLDRQNADIQTTLEKSKQTNKDIMQVVSDITNGNLKTRIPTDGHDGEFLIMTRGINNLLEAFINPITEAMRIANEFSACNFSVRYDEQALVKGDFEKFKNALNNSSDCVSETIRVIQEQLGELTANAEEANASTEEVAASTRTLSEGAVKVSQNTEKSNYGVMQVLKAMEDFTTTVNQVASRTDQVSKLTSEADGLSHEGANLARVAEQGMERITQSTQEISQIIGDIRSQMEEIGKIVGLIQDISEQTNLLALNAAIEAARAGEAGLGFAVVANEVKSLAQETQGSAENIANIIGMLQKRSVQAADAMGKTSSEVAVGGKALGDALVSFTRIVELINEINWNVSDVAAASEEQAASVEEITASIHEVSGLVNNTAEEAEISAHSSEEAANAVDQISNVINNLNGIVERVEGQVRQFRI